MKRKILSFLAMLAASALLTVIVMAKLYTGGNTTAPSAKTYKMLSPGTKAPLFHVENMEGEDIFLGQYRNRQPVLLFFWSYFSALCRDEIPRINQIAKRYRKSGLMVLGVNIDGAEMKRVLQRLLEKADIEFTMAIDDLGEPRLYGVERVPSLCIIDKSGTVSFSKEGAISYEELSKEIARVIY